MHWLLITLALAAGGERVVFTDTFEGRLAGGWRWVHEVEEGWRIDREGLWIRALPGTLWGKPNNGKNQLLRAAPAGDAVVSVTLRMNPADPPRWEQAGLLWYSSDDDFIKLVKELEHGRWNIVMGREQGGRTQVLCVTPIEDGPVRLQLQREGQKIIGRYRIGEGAWKIAAESTMPHDGAGEVGLKSQRGPKDAEHWNHFNDFEITQP
jgi:regulation of enolase protein 1 (concanavalin A-like superfamily)